MNDLILDDLDNDELDLVKLVSTNANDLNQYLLFRGSNNDIFGLNVSKVEEVLIYDKSIQIAKNTDDKNIIFGTADIRDTMTTLVYFDDWFGNTHLDDSDYELVILVNYGGQKLGIIVKEVLNISTIEADKMSDNSHNDDKTTFVSKLNIQDTEELCTIYDGDKMLLDIFGDDKYGASYEMKENLNISLNDKLVYFADDSKLVRNMVEDLFKNLKIRYEIFEDGSLLINTLEEKPDETVDIVITDLEMPHMGGREVVSLIRKNKKYDATSIFVHTNMSNNIMNEELLEIGADMVIGKMNIQKLSNMIIGTCNS